MSERTSNLDLAGALRRLKAIDAWLDSPHPNGGVWLDHIDDAFMAAWDDADSFTLGPPDETSEQRRSPWYWIQQYVVTNPHMSLRAAVERAFIEARPAAEPDAGIEGFPAENAEEERRRHRDTFPPSFHEPPDEPDAPPSATPEYDLACAEHGCQARGEECPPGTCARVRAVTPEEGRT